VIQLDTSFLIRALVRGSGEDRRLRTWLTDTTPLTISAIAWTEFLCDLLAPSRVSPQVCDAQPLGPGGEFPVVEPVALDPQHAYHLTPLPVGSFAAAPKPFELPQHGVLGRIHAEDGARFLTERFGSAARHAMGVERVRANDEDVHLHTAGQVYGVEGRAAGDRVGDGVRAHVPLTAERLHQARRLAP
jgi:hypothetical protein